MQKNNIIIQNNLEEISDKINDRDNIITDISNQIDGIHDIYCELANIVESQAEPIEKICDNISNTKNTTNLGLDQIKKAEKKQTKCNIQ